MKAELPVINQLFELQQKIHQAGNSESFERNFSRLFAIFEEEGFTIIDPVNELYVDSRTDCEVNIVGNISDKMMITKTLKPAVYRKTNGNMELLQKAVVIAEAQKK